MARERNEETYLSVQDNEFCLRSKNRIMKFDETLYTMLCTEYEKAVREGLEQFSLDGQPILTSYAKYLIEYLSPYFGKEKS